MSGVSESYMREKLRQWCPHWNPDTIASWRGAQLEQIYRRVQREVVEEIERRIGGVS